MNNEKDEIEILDDGYRRHKDGSPVEEQAEAEADDKSPRYDFGRGEIQRPGETEKFKSPLRER